jgi:hypothetical protein
MSAQFSGWMVFNANKPEGVPKIVAEIVIGEIL